MKKLALAILLAFSSTVSAQTVNTSVPQINGDTGNIVYTTVNPAPPGADPINWNGFTVSNTNGGGLSGGNIPAYNPNTGTFIFGYTQGTVNYVTAVNYALSRAGTGIQVNGLRYSWEYFNQDYSRGSLIANLGLKNSNGQTVENYNFNLPYTTQGWTQFSGIKNFGPYDPSSLGSLSVSFTGKDDRFWAGYYGPQVRDIDVRLLYSAPVPNFSSWERLVDENGTFTLSTPGIVRYGAQDTYIYKSYQAGTYECSNGAWGQDPLGGVYKSCSLGTNNTTTTPTTPTTTTTAAATTTNNIVNEITTTASQPTTTSTASASTTPTTTATVAVVEAPVTTSSTPTATTTKSTTTSVATVAAVAPVVQVVQQPQATTKQTTTTQTASTTSATPAATSTPSSLSIALSTVRNNEKREQAIAAAAVASANETAQNAVQAAEQTALTVAATSSAASMTVSTAKTEQKAFTPTTQSSSSSINQLVSNSSSMAVTSTSSTSQQFMLAPTQTNQSTFVNSSIAVANTQTVATTTTQGPTQSVQNNTNVNAMANNVQTTTTSMAPPTPTVRTAPVQTASVTTTATVVQPIDNRPIVASVQPNVQPLVMDTTPTLLQAPMTVEAPKSTVQFAKVETMINQDNDSIVFANNFLTNRANPLTEIVENNTRPTNNTVEQKDRTLNRNAANNELAGGVQLESMATQPAGYNSYLQFAMRDVAFYAPKEIYRNQRVIDNQRAVRLLNFASELKHQEMVNQQYGERK